MPGGSDGTAQARAVEQRVGPGGRGRWGSRPFVAGRPRRRRALGHDGTLLGTRLVADIVPGPTGSDRSSSRWRLRRRDERLMLVNDRCTATRPGSTMARRLARGCSQRSNRNRRHDFQPLVRGATVQGTSIFQRGAVTSARALPSGRRLDQDGWRDTDDDCPEVADRPRSSDGDGVATRRVCPSIADSDRPTPTTTARATRAAVTTTATAARRHGRCPAERIPAAWTPR